MVMSKYYHVLLLFFIWAEVSEVSSTSIVTSNAKDYWNLKLCNLSMPTLLEEMLPNPSGFDYMEGKAKFNKHSSVKMYSYDYDLDTPREKLENSNFKSMFIREEELLKQGSTHELQYLSRDYMGPGFMLKEEQATKAAFKSKNYGQLLKVFSIDPSSEEAQLMNFTLLRCESMIDHHVCVSTLESMADYMYSQFQPSISSLEAFSIDVTSSMEPGRRYGIGEVKQAGNGGKVVSCHKGSFPFGVFMCHELHGRAYEVTLNHKEKGKVKTYASCHDDTSSWSPRYGAFKILNLTPGDTVCHFLLGDSVLVFRNPT